MTYSSEYKKKAKTRKEGMGRVKEEWSDLDVCLLNQSSGLGSRHALVADRLAKDRYPRSQRDFTYSYSYHTMTS